MWVLSAVLGPVFPLLQGLKFQLWLLEGSSAMPRHSLWVPQIFLDLPPSNFTLAVLLKRKSLSQLYILPCTPARRSFGKSPSFQTLSNAFDRSKKTARTVFFAWKASSMSCVKRASWSSVLRKILSIACLCWSQNWVWLKMPYEPFVDDHLQKLSNTAEQTDRAVAGRILLVFSFFWNGSYESFLPDCWYNTCWPALVVGAQ